MERALHDSAEDDRTRADDLCPLDEDQLVVANPFLHHLVRRPEVVILTTKGIDDLCLKEFVEAGAMAVRRCKKEDLRRIVGLAVSANTGREQRLVARPKPPGPTG
jgi:hypothetical protein